MLTVLIWKIFKVLIATFSTMAVGMSYCSTVGGFWYSEAGFGQAWLATVNLSEAQIKETRNHGMMRSMLIEFASRLARATVFFVFINNFDHV